MSKFHNPYHFVPINIRTDAEKKHELSVEEARSGNWGGHSHESYGKGLHSGRLVCRLTIEGPVVIGASQKDTGKNQPKLILPFELQEGRPAIPASSLRGMFSSLVEAASNSALRVLDSERPLSSRVLMGSKDVLSAIGLIVKKDNRLHLLPLAMPSLELDNKKRSYVIPEKNKRFIDLFRKNPRMKSYIDRNTPINGYCYLPSRIWSVDGISASDSLRYPSKKGEMYCLKTDSNEIIPENDFKKLPKDKQRNYRNIREPNKNFVIGQKESASKLLTENKWRGLPSEQKAEYCRGFMRILNDREIRSEQMPPTKKHELFIPFPEDIEKRKDELAIPINDEAIKTFNAMAKERTREQLDDSGEIKKDKDGNSVSELALLPFHPLGTQRSLETDKPEKYYLTLKEGDLVYFDVDDKGESVTKVSFSSIWRIPSGNVGEYFPEELLPFNKKRTAITPAETLFGFVQNTNDNKAKSLAFKGKVRCSFGLLDRKHASDFYLYKNEPQILKILGSPKLPSPTLYFKSKSGFGHIDKRELSCSSHIPQGRKEYLRRQERPLVDAASSTEKAKKTGFWLTNHTDSNLTQKVKVTPIKQGLEFWFHIDFVNLSDWERALLCFAIQPDANAAYRHKLGMGKSLGLGQVKIEPAALLSVDRENRYSFSGLSAPRYGITWKNDKLIVQMPDSHNFENKPECPSIDSQDFYVFADTFLKTADDSIIKTIQLLGDPSKIDYDVHTPQVKDNGNLKDIEDETFKWFVENDKTDKNRRAHSQQQLTPITNNKLPALTYIDLAVQHTDDRSVASSSTVLAEGPKMSGAMAAAFEKAGKKK